MTSTLPPILFFGTDSFSVSALQHLIDAGYIVAAVITKPDSKSGRGQRLTPPAVKLLAESQNIPVWQPSKLSDITEDIAALQPVAGVLSSYGRIIPQSIIELFTPGIINVHPSLLPHYRGPSPIESAILHGDEETGVSIMQLTAEMDAGPLYGQNVYPLNHNETQPELYEKLADFGSSLLIQELPRILDGSLQPKDQLGEVSYSPMLQKSDAMVSAEKWNAAELARKVRAHMQFPKTKLSIHNQTVTITAAHESDVREDELAVQCADGLWLIIDELIGPSGRRMSGKDFRNGYAAA
jgi:methionyl-tRNA formyltransferase